MSSWRLRWLILGPVLTFVAGALLFSCGGGSSGCTGSFDAFGNFMPGVCPSPGAGTGFNLEAINICEGPAATHTPTPTSSGAQTPTATPTATMCPQASPTAVPVGPAVVFHANGMFVKKSKTIIFDITTNADTLWTSSDSTILVPPNSAANGGMYQPLASGCACVGASKGGISSLPVGVTVFSTAAATPVCPQCPTPIPTASPTPAAAATTSIIAPVQARLDGVMQWSFDAMMPLAGPIAPAPDGNSYFLTVDGQLHALDKTGHERWRQSSGGQNIAVGPDGTVYALGAGGIVEALSAVGKPLWSMSVASAQGPLAASASAVYIQTDKELIAASAPGVVQWRTAAPDAITSAAISDSGSIIAGAGGASVIAIDSNGSQRWSFSPQGGFAGAIALQGNSIYLGSGSGRLYALDAANGAELWHYDTFAPVTQGPVVNASGPIFFGSDAVYALSPDGKLQWTRELPKQPANPLTADGEAGVLAPTNDGVTAMLNSDGSQKWATRSFGSVATAVVSPDGVLLVGSSDGRVFALK